MNSRVEETGELPVEIPPYQTYREAPQEVLDLFSPVTVYPLDAESGRVDLEASWRGGWGTIPDEGTGPLRRHLFCCERRELFEHEGVQEPLCPCPLRRHCSTVTICLVHET